MHLTILTETRTESDVIEINENIVLYNSGPDTNRQKIGGVGFLICKNQGTQVKEFSPKSNRLAYLEIQLGQQSIGIIACYAPTEGAEETDKESFYEGLETLIQQKRKQETLIISGDFNARIGAQSKELYPQVVGPYTDEDTITNDNGERLLDLCQSYGFRIENSYFRKPWRKKHTWYHPATHKGVTLDYILTRNETTAKVLDVRASRAAEANSDHTLLSTIIRLRASLKHDQRIQRETKWNNKESIRNIKNNETKYQAEINSRISHLSEYHQLIDCIKESAKELIRPTSKHKDWWNEDNKELAAACKTKRKLKQIWLSTKKVEDKERLNQHTRKTKQIIKAAKESYMERICEEAQRLLDSNEQHQAYEKINEAKKALKSKPSNKTSKNWFITAEQMADHYNALFDLNTCATVKDTKEAENKITENEFTMGELDMALRKLKNNKAPGENGIRAEHVKLGGPKLKAFLLEHINNCWMGRSNIPREWVDADVISLYKNKGSKKDPNNYRSIFLLDTIGKIYASMVCERIRSKCEDTLSEAQFGFRQNRSAEQAILCLRHLIQKAKDKGTNLIVVFVDLKKAFDTVPHNAIFNILNNIQSSGNVIHSIRQLMDMPRGKLRGEKAEFVMKRGVRQGSKEGPILFNLVFDDILKRTIDNINGGIELYHAEKKWYIKHMEYADDLCLTASSIEEATEMLQKLNDKLKENGMNLAIDKTKWMKIGNKETNGSKEEIKIENQEIEEVQSFTYLGSHVGADGGVKETVRMNIAKARRALTSIRPLLRANNLKMKTKRRLIECFIIPILAYGLSTIVLTAADSDKMNALLNTARRMILGQNNKRDMKVIDLHKKIPLPNPALLLQQRRLNLYASILTAKDNLVKKILQSNIPKRNMGCKEAHIKNWVRQLRKDIIEYLKADPDEWMRNPYRVKPPPDKTDEVRPKLVGEREKNIKCTEEGCHQMFAERKELYRHIRKSHTTSIGTAKDNQHICPMKNCNRTFKLTGWRDRHIRSCHPQLPTHKLNPKNETERETPSSSSSTTFTCPIENCSKRLPTWKDIINHCHMKHGYSAITNRYTDPSKSNKNTKTTMFAP